MSVGALLLHNTVCWIVLLFIGDRAYFLCYLSVIFSQLLMRSWALLNHFVLCVFSLSDRWRLPSLFFECPIRLRAGSWQCHCHCPTSAAAGLLKLPSSAMSRDTVPSVPCQFEVNTSLIRSSRCTNRRNWSHSATKKAKMSDWQDDGRDWTIQISQNILRDDTFQGATWL